MEDLVLALDLGTTNIKAGILDVNGNLLKVETKELSVERDSTGKAEHNPDVIFESVISICKTVVQGYEERVKIIVPSSYMFGFVPLDKDFKPLTGIITLLDTRSQETFHELLQIVDYDQLYNRTGCPPLFLYPFAKIYWLKQRKPEIFKNARYFLCSKSFICLLLTGEIYSDPSVSSSTQMMNIHSLNWDPYALSVLGIDERNLAKIVPAEKVVGQIRPKVAEMIGLGKDVKVLNGVYDSGAVALGTGALQGYYGIINLGTTAMIRVAYPKPVVDKDKRKRFQACYLCNNRWFIGGSINNAGIILKWFRDNIFNLPYDKMSELAAQDDSKDLFFLPFITGERYPEIGNVACGVFFGLKSHHTKLHMIRAGMEGVVFSLKLAFDALKENGIEVSELRAGGGGTNSNVWMNIFANVFNLPVKIPQAKEAALLGSSILGHYALGHYKTLDEATEKLVKIEKSYLPLPAEVEYYSKRYEFFKYLVSFMREAYQKHFELFSTK
ncbi:gluconokinase [Pseudothermotoga thermarum]|uniref:Carbohydrate kinase, FGGY n=1 Tax=Pseudothermotoga thermarum DSM 5069 TaxID=688269 RepID=F7YXE8_9THEM|nr:gluconokinase [Pseudothermotoga thermarum]AEH51797.1 Carbohydrate kinase, FGGY [Pseudothermotoga thermarum DSM 5069]